MDTQLLSRTELAERLLRTASRHSLDPDVEVDWSAPPVPGLLWLPEHRVTLYGTPLWDRLTPEQRVELSKQEVASQCSTGIWFEAILMHMLLRHHYAQDQVDAHARHTLTEVAEECRHSLMFGRFLTTTGCPDYGPGRRLHRVGRAFKALGNPTVTFAGALLVEEVLDSLQREVMRDASVQPLIRQVARVHVVEEARHIAFARTETARAVAALGRTELAVTRVVTAGVADSVLRALVHPRVYASVGLDRARRTRCGRPTRTGARPSASGPPRWSACCRSRGCWTTRSAARCCAGPAPPERPHPHDIIRMITCFTGAVRHVIILLTSRHAGAVSRAQTPSPGPA